MFAASFTNAHFLLLLLCFFITDTDRTVITSTTKICFQLIVGLCDV